MKRRIALTLPLFLLVGCATKPPCLDGHYEYVGEGWHRDHEGWRTTYRPAPIFRFRCDLRAPE